MESFEAGVPNSLSARAVSLRAKLSGRTVAAVATPMDENAKVNEEVLSAYARQISAQVDGVCVWAHTGRGLHLSGEVRRLVLREFRTATAGPVLAAVGPTGERDDFDSQLRSTIMLAEEAAALGADGLMVYPMSSLREKEARQTRTIRLHQEVAAAVGLPVIGFYLYERAGGIQYTPSILADICDLPGTVGVKLALLNDAIVCQDAIAAIRGAGGLAITGEDRMLGPSLMWGAESVLVGLGAAAAAVTTQMVRAWFSGDNVEFIAASQRLDEFAAVVFREPMDAYVQRMLWVAAAEGLIPEGQAHDCHGLAIDRNERRDVRSAFDKARATLSQVDSINDGRSARDSGFDEPNALGES